MADVVAELIVVRVTEVELGESDIPSDRKLSNRLIHKYNLDPESSLYSQCSDLSFSKWQSLERTSESWAATFQFKIPPGEKKAVFVVNANKIAEICQAVKGHKLGNVFKVLINPLVEAYGKNLTEDVLSTAQNIIHAATPVLLELFGCSEFIEQDLPEVDDLLTLQDGYQVIRDQVVSHILESLERSGINARIPFPRRLEDKVILLQIDRGSQSEVKKLKTGLSGVRNVELASSKNKLDTRYGELGDCCIISSYGFELERGDFQPIRMYDPETYENLGVVFVTLTTLDEEKAIVLAGIEPSKLFKKEMDHRSFTYEVVRAMKRLAEHHGINRIFTNCGDKDWKDDGRISQISEVRSPLKKLAQSPFELPKSSQVHFPAKFGEPISWVAEL